MSKEMASMQDDQCTLGRRIKELNDLCLEPLPKIITKDNFSCNKTKVVMKNLTRNSTTYQQAIYAEFSDKMDMIQKTIDTLVSEKVLLVHSNNNMKKEISTLKSILSTYERKSCKYWVQKSDLNAIEIKMKNFKNHTKKNVKDLRSRVQTIEARLKSSAYTNQNNGSYTGKLIRQYNQLKMKLHIVERDLTKYSEQTTQNMMIMSIMNIKKEVQVPVSKGHYGGDCQQAYYSPTPQAAYSEAPAAPIPAPPPPPKGLLVPSEPQYPRYSISSDQLQAMSKELRKTGSDEVRKIPMRADMKIPRKVKITSDQAAEPLPPLEPPVYPEKLVTLPPVESPVQSIPPPVSPVQHEACPSEESPVQTIPPPVSQVQPEACSPVESLVQSIEPLVSQALPVECSPVKSRIKSIELPLSPVKPEASPPVEDPMKCRAAVLKLCSAEP